MDITKNDMTVELKRIKDTKCPNCGGNMQLNPTSGKLSCSYCDYSVELSMENEMIEEKDLHEENQNRDNVYAKEIIIVCKSCGVETFLTTEKMATVCEFCGSNQLIKKESSMIPHGIVPFEIEEKDIEEYFNKWIKEQKDFHNDFYKNHTIDHKKGMYLPCWSFDAKGTLKDQVYNAQTDRMEVRFHEEDVDDYLVLSNDNYNYDFFHHILPFDTSKNKEYKKEYLAGYHASYYNVGLRDSWLKGFQEIWDVVREGYKKNVDEYGSNAGNPFLLEDSKLSKIYQKLNANAFKETEAYKNYIKDLPVRLEKVSYKYLLVPVYLFDVKYENQEYSYMINGQTGTIAGTPVPISKTKKIFRISKKIALIALIVAIIVILFMLIVNYQVYGRWMLF